MRRWALRMAIGAALVALGGGSRLHAQGPSAFGSSSLLPTSERAGARYLGTQACAGCHAKEARAYAHAGMNKAAERVDACKVLADRPAMAFVSGPYRYRVERQGAQTLYRVTDGQSTVQVPITWCVGHGQAGQTWVFEKDGVLHESRISYYSKIDGLDFTMGAPPGVPTSLSEAVGRPMGKEDVRGCFGCHTTFSSRGSELQVEKAIPGVTCEGCHGPGGEHAAALGRGNPKERGIFNPGQLATEAQSNFCGNCHRSWEQVMLAGIRGIANVRFQPYRLTNSKCYDTEDARISCTACHDPHEPLKREARSYDAACLACHTQGPARKAAAKSCPKAKAACSSCHMPRYEIPGSHFDSTDHRIRVVRPGDPYPD